MLKSFRKHNFWHRFQVVTKTLHNTWLDEQVLGFFAYLVVLGLIRWFYLTIRCALQSGRDANPSTPARNCRLIAVRISRTWVGFLFRPHFWIATVRPLAFKAYCYITLAPWAIRGRLAVPAHTKSQARLRNGECWQIQLP